jgi:hypothetical protein
MEQTILMKTLVPALGLTMGITFPLRAWFGSVRRADVEQNAECLLEARCGGRFDGWNYSFPFVRLAAYDKFLVIASFREYVLDYREIEKVEIISGIFSKGLRLHHKRDDLPARVTLWLGDADKIKSLIESRSVSFS